MSNVSRRDWLKGATAAVALAQGASGLRAWAAAETLPHARPAKADRHFTSAAVEALIPRIQHGIGDPAVSTIFENCFPNTLDTTVFAGTFDGKPDTYIVTGDIDAMWLRDSSAQVWPYLALAKEDEPLRESAGRRDSPPGADDFAGPLCQCLHARPKAAPLTWAVNDKTSIIRAWANANGRSIRCVIRFGWPMAIGKRPATRGPSTPSGRKLPGHRPYLPHAAANSLGPYHFQRETFGPSDSVPLGGFGNPALPVGMIFSMFRPSDDACIYPLFVPANMFASVSLRKLAEIAAKVLKDSKLASESTAFADEVDRAVVRLRQDPPCQVRRNLGV